MKTDKNDALAAHVAALLLEIKAIKLNLHHPFTWSSGIKSPIYCDNRLSLSYPHVRDYIKSALARLINNMYPEAEAIAGVATAGIPQGVLVADLLDLPFLYVRAKPKGHGMENLIEGKTTAGQKIVVVEDLISTGGSSLKASEALKAAGADVLGMVAIFTYGFPIAEKNFAEAAIPLTCLSNYEQLIRQAVAQNYIKERDLAPLQAWRKDPENW
jgi:orotate phosphoribosyltransferase